MKFIRRAWPYLLLALLVGANLVAWSQRQQIADWLRLRDYQPASDIVALADADTMTPYARKLFYINRPSLEDRESFNIHCSDRSEHTAVLGCYHGNRQGIYIYAVQDPRLNGVREVTAAHEMLHQAYDRLSKAEKERIDDLLAAYYQNGLTEGDVKTKLESYKHQKDVVLTNEMHSIFGSEVRDLPQELETYFQRYFTDRAKIVTLSEAYQGEFTRRKDLVGLYDAQLATLKTQITINKSELERQMAYLKAKEKEINSDIQGHDQQSYEGDVRDYNATVATYNALLTVTRGLIEEHNDIVNKRNDIAVEEQQLQKALDSRLDTPNTMQ